MSDITQVTAHFLRDGAVMEVRYWEIPRKGKDVAHLKVAGSEKPCECLNREEIRIRLNQGGAR